VNRWDKNRTVAAVITSVVAISILRKYALLRETFMLLRYNVNRANEGLLQHRWSFDSSDDGIWAQALYSVLLEALQPQISFCRHAVITGCISVNEKQ
jgi:hypothetical protein